MQRAKSDKTGAYWQIGAAYRGPEAEPLSLSLGYGTSGIVLALLRYHALTGDREIAELAHKSLEWVRHRAAQSGFAHGFYAGTPGLWWLYREAERRFPGSCGNWEAEALNGLRKDSTSSACGVALGTAGTLVGMIRCLERNEEIDACVRARRAALLSASGFAESGLFWNASSISLKPPLGFLFGNSGVEYSLAYSGAAVGEKDTNALLGSLARADAEYSVSQQNWPDFDWMGSWQNAEDQAMEVILDDIDRGVSSNEAPGYTLGWGSGLSGLLLARLALRAIYTQDPLAEAAERDVVRALRRLETVAASDWQSLPTSIQNGLSGVALALRAAALRSPADSERLNALAKTAEVQLTSRPAENAGDDCSFLTGLAGVAYALMGAAETSEGNILDPLGGVSIDPISRSMPEVPPSVTLGGRMPACAHMPGIDRALAGRALTLGLIRAHVQQSSDSSGDALGMNVRAYEIGLQEALASTNFRSRFWHELAAVRRFMRRYGDHMDENVLFGRFRVDDSVSLLPLDFDPVSRTSVPPEQKVWVLRQPGSNGIGEWRLSPLQLALLQEFSRESTAVLVIHNVVERVQTAGVSRARLAALALNHIREFIRTGQLFPLKVGSFDGWLTRRKVAAVRKALFEPAA